MGYSTLLWSIPESGLYDGDVVPVYIKSTITGVYVIGMPDNQEEKLEVPLWQITEPLSKSKALAQAEKYADYRHMYARVVLDGLPMRAEAVNTSKQVYRLRKNEIIKVLYKGKGQAVMSGSNAMEGDWLRVLASDGTEGWCFSYNLRLFDETVQDDGLDNVVEEADSVRDNMLESVWYPEEYKDMVEKGTIDLSKMKRTSAFDSGYRSGEVRLDIEDLSVRYPYEGVTKTSDNVYKFNNTPITVTVRKSNLIVVQYIGDRGMPVSYNLVTLNKSSAEFIDAEILRRQEVYSTLCGFGPYFVSSNYGTLHLNSDWTFEWTGWDALSPSVIPKGAGNTGTVSLSYFLVSSLTFQFDGVITLKFNGSSKEISFLYTLEDAGIRLEDATKATYKDNVIRQRGANSSVIYFSYQSAPDADSR